jgi:hypothetical protein
LGGERGSGRRPDSFKRKETKEKEKEGERRRKTSLSLKNGLLF